MRRWLVLLLALAGCSAPVRFAGPAFNPLQFFTGHVISWGVEENRAGAPVAVVTTDCEGVATGPDSIRMVQVLHVYREVEIWREKGASAPDLVAVLSYDEKPGIQAIQNTAPDLPPIPGKHAVIGRDHEYIRHGTVSLLAGIDLLSGEVLGLVRKRHRSAEFIEFLKLADAHYPAGVRIRIVLDNHSAHISRQTRSFLATLPNRFEFTFTPKHGSWLNLIESFFAKMAKTLLRGIRVASAEELKARIDLYLREVNETPVVFRWKYKLDTLSVV